MPGWVKVAKGCDMSDSSKVLIVLIAVALAGMATVSLGGPQAEADREAELEKFSDYVDDAFPTVIEMTGIEEPEPVPIVMLWRSEIREFLLETVDREYPEDELVKRGECMSALGFLPMGYDLEGGFIRLITDEAGAFYDPHTDDLKGIADLPPMLKTPQMQKMIISHELTHALQDRVIDIGAISRVALTDMDYEYCLRVVIEGMACNVMMAYMYGVPLEEAPDVQATLRAGFDMKYGSPGGSALSECPLYLRESLLNPYAEGGGFVQTWLRKNPDKKMKDLLTSRPSTSEQVIHYEKYESGEGATPMDLSRLDSGLPGDWTLFYTNTLGEFDFLLLFQTHEQTRRYADELAAGWSGCRWQAYRDRSGGLVIIGLSAWDSERDAADFHDGFTRVLSGIWERSDYELIEDGKMVAFIVGAAGVRSGAIKSALGSLVSGPELR